jgi:hypothetical protein
MLFLSNSLRGSRLRSVHVSGCSKSTNVSGGRDCSVFGRSWRALPEPQGPISRSIGGRSPPMRQCRGELQAMSNSLQLTSI